MINLLAIGLVFTSLLTAQVYSPNPKPSSHHKEDVIVKEGHRVIVVETYDEEGQHNTKVSISPPQDPIENGKFPTGFVDNAKEEIKKAYQVLPNLGQGISYSHNQDQLRSDGGGEVRGPKELICDGLGKCTHKIARAKEKVTEKAHEVIAKKKEIAHEAKEAAKEDIRATKRIAHEAKDKVEDAYEKTNKKAHEAKEAVGDAYEKTKEMASQKAHDTKAVVGDAYEKTKDFAAQKAEDVKESAKESFNEAKDIGKTIGKDISRNVSKQMGKVIEKTEEAKRGIRRSFNDADAYLSSTGGVATYMRVIDLLGFATAYGMCIWVTFISSHVLANALTRNQFGLVQSKIYPVYFTAMAYCIGVALLGHLVGQRKWVFTRKADMLQVFNLLASLLVVLMNALYLEPLATKVMFEKLKLEKEEGRGRESGPGREREQPEPVTDIPEAAGRTRDEATTAAAAENPEQQEIRSRMIRMDEKLKRLNSYSSFLNILNLMSLTWHSVYLGQCLHVSSEKGI